MAREKNTQDLRRNGGNSFTRSGDGGLQQQVDHATGRRWINQRGHANLSFKRQRFAAPTPAASSAPASSAPAAASAGAGQTITVWTAEDPKLFTALMATFTKATDIKVNVEAVPWSNLDDKLTTASLTPGDGVIRTTHYENWLARSEARTG